MVRMKSRALALLAAVLAAGVAAPSSTFAGPAAAAAAAHVATRTPIEHVVVIFQENVSFDHYSGIDPATGLPIGRDDDGD